MNRAFNLVLFIVIITGVQPVSARPMYETQTPLAPTVSPVMPTPAMAAPVDTDGEIPGEIYNNRFFLESQRLAKLAQETYNYGDYDASYSIARDAFHYAVLSDVHVAIATAKFRLDSAVTSGASKQYPTEFGEAQVWYGVSLRARDDEEWDKSIEAAHKVVELIALIRAPDQAVVQVSDETYPLPASYTVRSWMTFRDCFWNIAARPWVYGNPYQWRTLYNANRSKLPDPDNPNLIEPGLVLDIPSIKGETRQGAWDSGKSYSPLE